MKNNPYLRLLAFLLLAAFVVSLTGCGKQSAPPAQTDPPAAGSETAAPEEVSADGLETRWKVESIPAPEPENDVAAMVLAGDRLYAAYCSDAGPSLYVSDLSGSDWQALEIPEAQPEEETGVIGQNLAGLAVNGSGAYLLTSTYTEQGTVGTLYSWDASDAFNGSVVLEGAESFWFDSCTLLGDKLLLSDHLYSLQGEPLGTVPGADQGLLSVYATAGDRVFAYTESESGKGVTLWEMDGEGALSSPVELPDFSPYYVESCASEEAVCVASSDGLWTLDPATGERTEVINWLEAGVDSFWLSSVHLTAAGEIYLTCETEILRLSSYRGPARQKLELAVGAGAVGIYVDKAISIFNQSSEDYVVRERRIMPEDMEAFRTELISGKGPDLLCLGSTVDKESSFTRFGLDSGLCADLLPYIDADPVYNRDAFLPGLLDSALEGGHLYQLDPGFQLYTIEAPVSLAEEAKSWTVDSLLALRDTLPEGVTLFDGYSRSSLADIVLYLASVEYVDRENATCFFDDPSFAKWLEIWNSYTDDQMANADSAALQATTVHGGLPNYLRQQFGQDYFYAGLPGREGCVHLIRGLGGFSILAASQHKDGAWAFLRTLLDVRVQAESITGFSFPVTVEAFDRYTAKLMGPDSYTTFTQEDADRLKEAVAQAKGWVRGDVISDIITEEAEKAFASGRPLEEAAAAIQSRAKIYLAEQYS